MLYRKRMVVLALGAAVALVGGGIYAAAGERGKTEVPVADTVPNGEAVQVSQQVPEELFRQAKSGLPISGAKKYAGKVEHDVHTPVDPGDAEEDRPTAAIVGNGKTGTPEAPANDAADREITVQLGEAGVYSNKTDRPAAIVSNGAVVTPERPADGAADREITVQLGEAGVYSNKTDDSAQEPEDRKPAVTTYGDGEVYTAEELAQKLGITVEELESRVQVVEVPIDAES